MSLTLIVTRQNGGMIAERILRFEDGTLSTRVPQDQ